MTKTKRLKRLRMLYLQAKRKSRRKHSVKRSISILLLPVALFASLFFKDMGSIDSKDDFRIQDLNAKIEKLEKAWRNGSLIEFLREKGTLRSTLKEATESKSINLTTKKNVISIMNFMFPEDVPNRLMIDYTAAKRMKEIERSTKSYKAQLEYKLLERETYLTMERAYLSEHTLNNHKKILKIYREIAGVEEARLETKDEKEENKLF